jgi:hypothetical protein
MCELSHVINVSNVGNRKRKKSSNVANNATLEMSKIPSFVFLLKKKKYLSVKILCVYISMVIRVIYSN